MRAKYTGISTPNLRNGETYDVREMNGNRRLFWVKSGGREYIVILEDLILEEEDKSNNNPDSKTYPQYELENMLQNAITYGIKEITGHTIGDKIASVLVEEFLDTLDTPNNTNNISSNYVLSSDNEEDLWWLRAAGMNGGEQGE